MPKSAESSDKPALARSTRVDGELTRGRILEAAGQMFAEHGYADVTNKAIAEAAGADQASINYHFGSRSGLYAGVLAYAHRQLIRLEELEAMSHADTPPESRLRQIIAYMVKGSQTRPQWPVRVLARELLAPSSHLEALAKSEGLPKLSLILEVVGELAHLPPQHPTTARLALSVFAPCFVCVAAGPAFTRITGTVTTAFHDDLVDHLHQFALSGIRGLRDGR